MLQQHKITVSLDEQTLDLLKLMAEKNKTSRSQMLRQLIMEKSSWDNQIEINKRKQDQID